MSTQDTNRVLEEGKVKVSDVDIHYIKVGCGDHVVLFLHGFMGSALLDFEQQLKDMCVDDLTLIAWDAPGFGRSRPPDRKIPNGYIKKDATYARDMMIALGYSKFSVFGWCNGGFVAMELAAMYPENVRRLIVFGAKAYYTQQDVDSIRKICRLELYPKWRRDQVLSIYNIEYANRIWDVMMNHIETTYKLHGGEICRDALPKIRCPTLIIHGDHDAIVSMEHAFYLKEHISGSKLKMLNGGHTAQRKYSKQFNDVIREFLTEEVTTNSVAPKVPESF